MITLTPGSFYVDENLYYLYGNKECLSLDTIKYQIIELDKSFHLLNYIPERISSDVASWASSEIGVFVSSVACDYIVKENYLYVKSNTPNIVIHGYRPILNSGENTLTFVQTELEITSELYTFLIPNPEESPIVITDDALYPTDLYCYQQHRYYIDAFNNNYSKIVLNAPRNMFPDPDFSQLYAYSGSYSSEAADLLGRAPISGYIDYSKDNYISPATRLDVLFSGDIYIRLRFVDLVTGITSDYDDTTTSTSLELAQMVVGPYIPPTIYTGAAFINKFIYSSEIFESIYRLDIRVSGEHVKFIQATQDIYKNEFNHNRFSDIYIEYSTSDIDYTSEIDISPYTLVNNRGFLVYDEVYMDTSSETYDDFCCTIRSTLPYSKLTGINKYNQISLKDEGWMSYPSLEYRYGHDRPVLDELIFGYVPVIADITSDITLIARDGYKNNLRNVTIALACTGENNTTMSIATATLVTSRDGIATTTISFEGSSEALTLTATGEDFFFTPNKNPSNRFFVSDTNSWIYQHGMWTEFFGTFTYVDLWRYREFEIDSHIADVYPIQMSGDLIASRCSIYLYSNSHSSEDLSTLPFTGEDYRILKQVDESEFIEEGCYSIKGNVININANAGYCCVKYKPQHIWTDSKNIYFSKYIASAISSDMISPQIAYDIEDTLIATHSSDKTTANIIYPYALITKQGWLSI